MKITVLQPNLFPFKSYFDIVKRVDKVVFADDTYYNKKSWVNKTVLKKNGKKLNELDTKQYYNINYHNLIGDVGKTHISGFDRR